MLGWFSKPPVAGIWVWTKIVFLQEMMRMIRGSFKEAQIRFDGLLSQTFFHQSFLANVGLVVKI